MTYTILIELDGYLSSYFYIDENNNTIDVFNKAIGLCENWHNNDFNKLKEHLSNMLKQGAKLTVINGIKKPVKSVW